MRRIMENKKGQLVPILVLVLFFMVIIGGALILSLGSGVATFTMDTINDITGELDMVDNSNLSVYSGYTVDKVNDVVQMFKWGSGVLIIFAFLGILIFAAGIRANPNGFLIGLYILLVVVLIITSIFVSNIYEEFLNAGDDDIALELQSMPLTSYLVIYMPQLITILGFIGGIIIFTGTGDELG